MIFYIKTFVWTLKVETAEKKKQKGHYPMNQFYNQMCRIKYAIFEWEMI